MRPRTTVGTGIMLCLLATTGCAPPAPPLTEVEGVVDSVDLTQTPPVLSVNGGNYTMDKIKRIVVPSSANTGTGSS